ncbi:MAG TPA: hypothetical protein VGI45_11150 [Terracidiphilus sp.]|jgi:tetratricopeptide (TPR) repeat protein
MISTLYHAPQVDHELALVHEQSAVAFPKFIPLAAQNYLVRMFRDPYLLEPQDRVELIAQLRDAIATEPALPELRVLLGMALCVNFEAQSALEELRESVYLAPDNFLARLKLGELLMRLRICDQAAEETRMAAELASNPLQSELARRQAATIRTMQREGIERGGYSKLLSVFSRIRNWLARVHPVRGRAVLEG